MTDAHVFPIVQPLEGESLSVFIRRAMESYHWPASALTFELELIVRCVEEFVPAPEQSGVAGYLLRALSFTVDPSMALRHLDAFLRSHGEATSGGDEATNAAAGKVRVLKELRRLRDNSEYLHFLCSLFSFSDFLSRVTIRTPEYLDRVFRGRGLNQERSLAEYRSQLKAFVEAGRANAGDQLLLTRFKNRELLRIGIRDLMEVAGTSELCRELSNLAQAIVEHALELSIAKAKSRHGRPIAEGGGESGFCIYAMGKFGAGELNFSSDIDLVFIYDEEGETEGVPEGLGGGVVRRVSNHEYFNFLSREICQFLNDRTEDGFLYRVDMRLRPEGASGPLARSRPAFVSYFGGQASLWEKIAYLKARCIAGDEQLARRFDPIIQQFVFTNNTHEELFPEIARLKRRIDHDSLNEESRNLDIKRGIGGIREIEFIVAGIQLLMAEKEPSLRVRSTLEALELLVSFDQVPSEDADVYAPAYHFYRRIEHTLQMMHESQTHRMPSDATGRAALALRCGYSKLTEFERQLDQFRRFVRSKFEETFQEDRPAGALSLLDFLFMEEDPPEEILAELNQCGLGSFEGFRALRVLAIGTGEYATSQRARQVFGRLLPTILAELEFVAQPLQAIRQFDLLLRSAKGFSWIYDLCQSNPHVLRFLLRILGFGSYLGRLLIAHPEWLDEIFNSDGLKDSRDIEGRCRAILGHKTLTRDGKLRQLRQFKQLEGFLICVQDVLAILPTNEAAKRMALLADVVLQGLSDLAIDRIREERSIESLPGAWTIIGLGGLGDYQVHMNGDLDLAFVVADSPVAGDASALLEMVNDIARFVLAEMSALTPEGQLWKVDARLRPDGKNGPLVATRGRFLQYYQQEAGLWEWQVLTKARIVAGNKSFGKEVLSGLHQVYANRPPVESLKDEIRSMRFRIEEHFRLPSNALLDLKRGAGCIVDVEFLVQYFQLAYPAEAGVLFTMTTERALEEFIMRGAIQPTQGPFILRHLALLRCVQRHHRLLRESTQDYLLKDVDYMASLRRGLQDQLLGSLEEFDRLAESCLRMRQIFEELMT